LSPDISKQSKAGEFFYYNCGPKPAPNILSAREDLVEACHERQLEVVRPYM